MPSDCLFCKLITREIPADIVYEDDNVLAFNDINPQAPTHILIIPKAHRDRLSAYDETDNAALGALLSAANQIAAAEGLLDYRTVINCGEEAGQTVWHLHLHLIGGRPLLWPPG